ncbi:MAG: hypothetical protein MJB12_19420 [Firmicutes bacterium]|nr:hypothetical protein [Bacillota bacterium]
MEPFITITTKIDQENIGEGLFTTALTGVIDIRQQFDVDGRRFLIEKVLPVSLISVVEEPFNCK